ncbi:hypothetical protein FKV24_010690, partial [Lysobacter maris]
MSPMKKIRVAVNGYGVIGKRVAEAVARQDDMELTGVADVSTDWRPRLALQKGCLVSTIKRNTWMRIPPSLRPALPPEFSSPGFS